MLDLNYPGPSCRYGTGRPRIADPAIRGWKSAGWRCATTASPRCASAPSPTPDPAVRRRALDLTRRGVGRRGGVRRADDDALARPGWASTTPSRSTTRGPGTWRSKVSARSRRTIQTSRSASNTSPTSQGRTACCRMRATVLLAIREGRVAEPRRHPRTWAHVLYADEQPAFAAAMVARAQQAARHPPQWTATPSAMTD